MESSGSGPGERPSPGSRKPAILRMTVARPTIMRIMRPPSPGDIMELTPASIPPSSSFSDDHDNQQQQQQQSNTSNSSTIQIILNSNSPGNSQQTITLNQQQQPTGATNPFACNHCHWTSDSEERLLEHICAVHLETRANREDQEETSNNTGEQRGNKRKLKVVRISSSATGASNRRKQRMPSSTTSAAQQPKTTDDTSSSSANNETSTTTASTAHFHYVCQFLRCSKRFAKLDQLRQHHRGHLNLKPYHCTWPGCAQYFSRRPAALRHIRTSHFKVQREQLPELSAEERAQAHQFVGVVRERVAEEESALDAVRRAKKRIQIGGEPSRKITAAATAAFSSSKRPKPKRRANDEDEIEEEEENEESSQEEEVMEIEVEEEEPIIEEEAEQLLPVPPNSEPLADDDQQPQQQPQLSQSTCGGGGLSPHRYVCPFPRCADLPAHRYVCQFPRCDKVYSRLYALRMHHRSHTKTQPYYCKFPVVVAAKDLPEDAQETATTTTADPAECGETFRRRANAARHVLAKHYGVPKAAQPALSKAEKGRALPYIGERAKVLAREEASLESLRVNKPRDPSRPPLKYRCGHPGCGKYFPAPGKLLLHQRTHSESLKPFFCRWEGCPKRAVTERATLLKHILREHLGVSFPRRTLLPAEEGAEAEEGEEEVVIGDEEGNQVRFTRPSTAEKPKSNATTSSAFSEAEKAAAAPYVGVHQHLLEQERRTVLTRTEEVVEERQGQEEEEEVTADYYGESGLTYRKKRSGGGGFNFQSFFSVPMSAPFPPVHYGPVFAVQIAVHKID